MITKRKNAGTNHDARIFTWLPIYPKAHWFVGTNVPSLTRFQRLWRQIRTLYPQQRARRVALA